MTKKILLSLAVILLLCGVKIVISSADGKSFCADSNSLLNLLSDDEACQPTIANKPNPTDKPNLTVGSNSNIGVRGLFYRMMLMVLLVVFLGAAVIYLSKKLLPKINHTGRKIQLTETIHLGPRKSLHLITIGEKTLLIGSTNENISNLADVSEQMMEFEE